mmetsp:Transcript_1609/g.4744  ORF Transcript_1609/g.4744 Transcript_1609/m.4744 type:complete len:255 (+) Transcript_1609:1985-2749(+)
MSANSASMLAFSAVFFSCSVFVVCSSCSTSWRRSAERCIASVMRVNASSASFCFSESTFCFSSASAFSCSTVCETSNNFCKPFCKCVDWPDEVSIFAWYICLHVSSKVMKCLGHAPMGCWDSWMRINSRPMLAFLSATMSPNICWQITVLLCCDHSSSHNIVVHEKSAGFAAQYGRKCGCLASMESTIFKRSRTCCTKYSKGVRAVPPRPCEAAHSSFSGAKRGSNSSLVQMPGTSPVLSNELMLSKNEELSMW